MKAKSPEGKIGEQWAKNGEKLPIVRHCRFVLTRSVRRDACSNFLLPGRAESGEGATKYFDAALATSKYYGSERGQWGGKGAERLGLHGDVSRKDFIALASNKRPGTDETLTVRMKTTRRQKEVVFEEKANTWKLEDEEVSNRRAGYDFCFSVPKSVSLYLAETGDRTVEQLIHESFQETMLDIENRVETRVRGKGEDGQVRN